MALLPEIKITYENYRGEARVFFRFEYDVDFVNLSKRLGAKYSSTVGAWHLPDTARDRSDLFHTFRGKAFMIWPRKAQKAAETTEARTTNVSKPLTQPQKQAIDNLIQLLRATGKGKSTIETYQQLAKRMLIYIGKNPWDINQQDVLDFQSNYLVKNNYANSTQRQFASSIKWLLEANHLPEIELSKVYRPKKEKRLPKVLSRGEVMAILSACQNLKHRAMLSLLYSAGLRVGEMIDLRITDINFEQNVIHIKRAKGRKDRMVVYGEAMGIMVRNYLNQYRPHEFLFNGQGKPRYSPTSVRAILKQAAKRARINKQVTPHMLRHSFATHMIEDGVNLRYVQELLGHTRPETTQIYTHVASDHLMKLKNPFDSLLKHYGQQNTLDNDLTNPPPLSRKTKK